jgi:hypothetical protein
MGEKKEKRKEKKKNEHGKGTFGFHPVISNYIQLHHEIHLWDKKRLRIVLTLWGEISGKNIPLNILLFGD